MKKILALILIITTMLIGGCSKMKEKSSTPKSDKIKSDIEDFLEKKYEKDFTIISLQGKEFLDSFKEAKVFAYPSDGDKEKDRFEAVRIETENGFEYKDEYFGLQIEDEYNERISKIFSKYFSKFVISSSFYGEYFSNEYGAGKTLQDAIDGGEDLFGNVRILTEPQSQEEFTKKIQELSKEINSLEVPMSINILNSSEEDLSSFYNDTQYSMSMSITVKRDMSVDIRDLIINNRPS